jgi:outer membrane protein assembly factor BamA
MRGDVNDVWKVIDVLRNDVAANTSAISVLQTKSDHCEKNQENTERKIDNMCEQLKITEREVMGKIEEVRKESSQKNEQILAAITLLKDAYLIRQGIETGAKENKEQYTEIKKTAISVIPKLIYVAFAAGMATIAYISGKGGNP